MEESYVISTSMLQYMEEMDSYLKKNKTIKTDEAIAEEESPINFNFDEQEENFHIQFEENAISENLALDFGQDVEMQEDVKSNYADCVTLKDSKDESTDKNAQEEVRSKDSSDNKKPKLSNKERARRARQRKKKYYDDLEKRVKYLEGRCESLSKELDYCKNKLAIYDGKTREGSADNFDSLDNKIFERMEAYINAYKGDEVNLINAIDNCHDMYGPFGKEKIKMLEKTFDNFLENILTGANFKLCFYAVDREMPKNYTEYQKYSRLKKYQQHEKYPDEHMREFFKASRKCFDTREGFNNFMKNKLPIIRGIKNQFKEAIATLFEAKNKIFEALMQCDLFKLLYPSLNMTKPELIGLLHEHKHSNFKVTYKEALEIAEKMGTAHAEMHLPNPNSYKKYRMKYLGVPEESTHPKYFSKDFTYRQLFFKE